MEFSKCFIDFRTQPCVKGIVGTAVGAGLSLASSLIGGYASMKANAKAESEMKAQKARNDAWYNSRYNRRYNEDYLDTAAGQNLARQAQEYADKNWKREQGAAAVGGGTDAAVAMAKEAGNKVVGDTLANIASADVQRKDNVDNAHMNMENNYSSQQFALAQNKAANISKVAGAASDAMMTGGIAYDQTYRTKDSAGV